MTTPRGAPELVAAQALPETTVNEQIRHTEAGAGFFPVVDKDLTAPPATCADGASYIVGGSATGLWSGKDDQIATAVGTNAASGWLYHAELEGLFAYVQDENALYYSSGTAWAEYTASGGGGLTNALTWDFNFADDGDAYVRAPIAMTVTEQATSGTGTIAYEKSTAAAPDTFSSTTSPITLEAGAKLKVTASSITGSVAVHLERTA